MTARFAKGDRVRVREAYPPGHVRTPHYLRGKTGTVTRMVAEQPNPEELAYGRDGLPPIPVYWVLFHQTELWPDYAGPESDTAVIDVQEHWLDAAEDDGR